MVINFSVGSEKQFYLLAVIGASFISLFLLICVIDTNRFDLYRLIQLSPSSKLPGWYVENGVALRRDEDRAGLLVWPEDDESDRIESQLMVAFKQYTGPKRRIYIVKSHHYPADMWNGDYFQSEGCPVDHCEFTKNKEEADAILFENTISELRENVPEDLIWILYVLENPWNGGFVRNDGSVNWTASYRSDSELVTPYAKWVYYDPNVRQIKNTSILHSAGKSGKAAWFISNCNSKNSRLEYALELAHHFPVDIYGECGKLSCSRENEEECFELLARKYKFYLAFENANCREYITEKFFTNALKHNVVPIVMGAHPDDYKAVAPEHSYIHVDDFNSVSSLAAYLNLLDKNPDMYSSYFWWKGTGEFINTRFFCRLCAMLNYPKTKRVKGSFRDWFNAPGTCRLKSWTEQF